MERLEQEHQKGDCGQASGEKEGCLGEVGDYSPGVGQLGVTWC